MVGVPGRSKGCNTCIQRKVKCDGGQPACGNCRKSNRLCTGYKRAVAFVMSSNVALGSASIEDTEGVTITTQGRWRKRTRKAPKALDQDPAPVHEAAAEGESAAAAAAKATNTKLGRAIDGIDLATTATDEDIKKCWKRYIYADGKDIRNERQQLVVRQPAMTLEALSRTIANLETSANVAMLDFASPVSATMGGGMAWPIGSPIMQHVSTEAVWREQLFPMFISFHLPNEIIRGCKSTTKSMRPRNWLLNLTETPLVGSPVLETAMSALCMARVGRKHNNMAIVQHSLSLYTKGLRQLQDAIHDPATKLADQTLAACMAFAMYEVAECPARHLTGYYSHHMGGLALLKMRGPDAHITPLGHSLFVFMRVQQFIYALMMRKSNFLSDPEWTSRPWQTSAKDPQDKFMDQMYCIPVLLEQTDNLAASNADADTLIRGYWDIIGQHQAIYNCLKGWYGDLQAIVAGPLYWPELSTIECEAFNINGKGRPFPVAFHFPAFSVGQSMMLFWLIVVVVNFQISELYKRIVKLSSSMDASHSGSDTAATASTFAYTPPSAGDVWSEPPSPASSSGLSSGSSSTARSSGSPSTPPPTEFPQSIPAMQVAGREALGIARTVAKNICQSVEFFLDDSMGDVGPLSMILPLTTLRPVLARMEPDKPCPPGAPDRPGEHSDDVIWVDYMIKYIGGKGHQLANYLDDDSDGHAA